MIYFKLIQYILTFPCIAALSAYIGYRSRLPGWRICKDVYFELRWFIPASICMDFFLEHEAWLRIIEIGNFIAWTFLILTEKDDDDRWKKRRKKVREKVASIGGRLVIVPTS